MKKYVKKVIVLLLTLAMMISVVPNKAYAESTNDVSQGDNNDIPSNATTISSKEAINGVLSTEEDVDYYKYTVDVSGYYSFTFTDIANDQSNWRFTVCDTSLNELESSCVGGYTLTTNTYDFKKGTVLYLKVNDYYWGDTEGDEYSIKVNTTSDPNWEQEYNDSKANATIISSNSALHGNLYSEDDVDYYKYTVDVTGYYNFTFTNVTAQSANWLLSVTDSSLNELEGDRIEGYTYTTNTYNFKKGTVLYLKVKDYYWGDSQSKEYTITVNAKSSSKWEQEKNNTYKVANTLKSNTAKIGNLYTGDDVDYYKYTATKTGTVKTTFTFDADDVRDGWKITIYDSSKKAIKTVSDITTDKTISFKATKGKKYYVVVRAVDNRYCPINISYNLKVKQ